VYRKLAVMSELYAAAFFWAFDLVRSLLGLLFDCLDFLVRLIG
jgi:hypothetical protein